MSVIRVLFLLAALVLTAHCQNEAQPDQQPTSPSPDLSPSESPSSPGSSENPSSEGTSPSSESSPASSENPPSDSSPSSSENPSVSSESPPVSSETPPTASKPPGSSSSRSSRRRYRIRYLTSNGSQIRNQVYSPYYSRSTFTNLQSPINAPGSPIGPISPINAPGSPITPSAPNTAPKSQEGSSRQYNGRDYDYPWLNPPSAPGAPGSRLFGPNFTGSNIPEGYGYQPPESKFYSPPIPDRRPNAMNPLQRFVYSLFNIEVGPLPLSLLAKTVFQLPVVYSLLYGPLNFVNPYLDAEYSNASTTMNPLDGPNQVPIY